MLAQRLRLTLSAALACGLLGLGAYSLAQVPAQEVPLQPEVIRVAPGQQGFDPFAGANAQQPKPEKIAPKGIEDDDVPLPSSPAQAVVRAEEGKLIVRQRGYHVSPVTVAAGNARAVTSYQRKSGVQASTYDPADVSVFDMKGNRLQSKVWKDKLKVDVHALVAFDGRLPNPRELTLYKDDTLVVVLPSPMGAGQWGVTEIPHPTPAPATCQASRCVR